jgi:glucan phosphoethanolaminetransferase (alkaline phosphatase superfamily)
VSVVETITTLVSQYAAFILVVAMLMLFLLAALLVWLWNATIPSIFGMREISFWEGMRLLLISYILFGGFATFQYNYQGGGFSPTDHEYFHSTSSQQGADASAPQ